LPIRADGNRGEEKKNGAPAFALTDCAAASQRNTDRFDLHHRRPQKNNSIHSIDSIHSIPVRRPQRHSKPQRSFKKTGLLRKKVTAVVNFKFTTAFFAAEEELFTLH